MAEPPPQPAGAAPEGPDPDELMRSRAFIGLLVIAAIVGVAAALVAFGFLEAIAELQDGLYDSLPDALGFESTPAWWPLPVLLVASLIVAWAIDRLPGPGGHIPANGLSADPTQPIDLPGVFVAALGGIGFGIVLGPEAPLIALGGGIGFIIVRRLARDAPEAAGTLMATSGVFSAISFLFGSPVIAAVLLMEVAGLDRKRMPMVLIPGLLAAGIGSLVSTGMGQWTGVDSSNISIDALQLEAFARPSFIDFVWTVPLAALVAVGVHLIFILGKRVEPPATRRPFVVLPLVGLATAVLAIAFHLITDHGFDEVLFSGQDQLSPFVSRSAEWSVGAVLLLLAAKGLAYGLALGSFRGGPVFPGLFLGAAAGVLAAKLPGFDLTPAVAVGMAAATVAVLRLPLSSIVLAGVLTSTAGLGDGALIILGVAVSFLVVTMLSPREPEDQPAAPAQPPSPAPS